MFVIYGKMDWILRKNALKVLDKIGRVVYNRFKMKNKVDYKTLQRIGGNSSPNLLHLPGRCYSFAVNQNFGGAERANALLTSWCSVPPQIPRRD